MKKDFPIFNKQKDLIYLDSTATTQKPYKVINAINDFLENDYASIHRWTYKIADNALNLYIESKEKVAKLINANSYKEIIYTYNSTYALNLLARSLELSKFFKKWDTILLSITEHHSNIVPWLILKETIWINIEYVKVDNDFNLDFKDLESKITKNVKLVSLTHVPNTTWIIYDLKMAWKIIKNYNENIIFVVDGSQSIPHIKVDVEDIWCDFMFFTWHKILANTWIAVLWWKEKILSKLNSWFSWWGAILNVQEQWFAWTWELPNKFEPWTPNITWAISLWKAIEYIEDIWWLKKVEDIEKPLIKYTYEQFKNIEWIKLIWENEIKNKVWVFSFIVDWIHSLDIADYLGDNNICIRAWQHCAEPFLSSLNITHTCRLSLYIYNTKEDLDIFFNTLKKAIKDLKI